MGECFLVRRGGEIKALPVLNAAKPEDASLVAGSEATATLAIEIVTPGVPAEYTYQWYKNGQQIENATGTTYAAAAKSEAGTDSYYCAVTSTAGTVQSRTATVTTTAWQPTYTYTGSSTFVDDGGGDWRLKLLTSGTLTFTDLGNMGSGGVDAFLVGGGGSGTYAQYAQGGGNGGGGGYTKTGSFSPVKNTAYPVVVGAGGAQNGSYNTAVNGGDTTAFGLTAAGGKGGGFTKGGDGGSGGGGGYAQSGAGGTNGGDGGGASSGNYQGGDGQGTSTREFGESTGALYAGGGGGGQTGQGGDGGGGDAPSGAGEANTGGGGAGGNYYTAPQIGGAGGSGIVIIRKHKE